MLRIRRAESVTQEFLSPPYIGETLNTNHNTKKIEGKTFVIPNLFSFQRHCLTSQEMCSEQLANLEILWFNFEASYRGNENIFKQHKVN